MEHMWILWYCNTYLPRLGLFTSEQAALAFVAESEHPDWYKAVPLAVQKEGATVDNYKKPINPLPPQGQR